MEEFLQVSGLRMHILEPASFIVSHNRDLEKTLWEAPGCIGQGRQLVKGVASFLTPPPFVLSPRPSILLPSSLCKGSDLGRL